jgi:PAS domain S-box-containing protein
MFGYSVKANKNRVQGYGCCKHHIDVGRSNVCYARSVVALLVPVTHPCTKSLISLAGGVMEIERGLDQKDGFAIDNIFNSISDYVSIHDKDFRIVRANAALCDFLGKTEDELIGCTCYTIFHDRQSTWPDCPHARVMDRKMPITELVEDSHIGIPLLITCSPVYNGSNEILGSVHIARNVSEARQDERRQKEIIAELKATLMELKGLSGILTICASCKNIRDDNGEWIRVEKYIADKTNVTFSHGICGSCAKKLYPDIGDF